MTTNDWPMIDVLRVKALNGHRLRVRFSDGNEGVRDFSDIFRGGRSDGRAAEGTGLFRARLCRNGRADLAERGFDLDLVNLYMHLRDAGALTRAAAE